MLVLYDAETWKRTKMGDLSTAGTTASTVIFRQDHIIVANVGDSTAILGVCVCVCVCDKILVIIFWSFHI